MKDLQSQRSKLSFLGLSLFDDLNICKKNIDHKMSGFWDRPYVRFFFSGVEGIAYTMSWKHFTTSEPTFDYELVF